MPLINGTASRLSLGHVLWGLVALAVTALVWHSSAEISRLKAETGAYPISYWIVILVGCVLIGGGFVAYLQALQELREYERAHQAVVAKMRGSYLTDDEKRPLQADENRLRRLVIQARSDLVYPIVAMLAGLICVIYALLVWILGNTEKPALVKSGETG